MSIEENAGDTEYFASTDYNQRLEEKAETQYEQKTIETKSSNNSAAYSDIDALIETKNSSALYQMASLPLSESDMNKLVDLRNKDIHIVLARNESITDAIGLRLIGTVYLAHKSLLLNVHVSENVKSKLKDHLAGNPTYSDLL